MDAYRFQNALRIMWNLDRHDLIEAGVFTTGDQMSWDLFRDNPHSQAIRFSEDRMGKLFALIESRQPKKETS